MGRKQKKEDGDVTIDYVYISMVVKGQERKKS
jgi:hypothetical protein